MLDLAEQPRLPRHNLCMALPTAAQINDVLSGCRQHQSGGWSVDGTRCVRNRRVPEHLPGVAYTVDTFVPFKTLVRVSWPAVCWCLVAVFLVGFEALCG